MNTLDTNPYLTCFQNGILDLKLNQFRKGLPQDNISLMINAPFIAPHTSKSKNELSTLIDDFQ